MLKQPTQQDYKELESGVSYLNGNVYLPLLIVANNNRTLTCLEHQCIVCSAFRLYKSHWSLPNFSERKYVIYIYKTEGQQ